jgi:fermentation-respiration switch protein FrsA (DUF1100 family)
VLLLALLAAWGTLGHARGPAPAAAATGGLQAAPEPARASPRFAVGQRVLRLVDRSRTIRTATGGRVPRTLVTYVRYPALGPPADRDVANAPAATADRPFPLVVFAHGFAVTPAAYARLLRSWARAGYVVAAPLFPLENAHAPGGPDESDVVNEPADVSFVISSLLAAAGRPGPLAGLLDPARIAVAGHSDGGEVALAVADSRRRRDQRVGAAIVLSGAEMSAVGGYEFAPGRPPLLAVQGTADTSNEPRFTYAFFRAARSPKYLLRLLGAQHLPPYTSQQPQLATVERVTTAFLDGYLGQAPGAAQRLASLGDVAGVSALVADP